MKREMRARFVPRHHCRDLFDKLHNLKQGSLSVDEYYKEMEKAMIRANVYEDQEQSIARFMSGLHRSIQRIVEFQLYRNLIELVHQASKAECQLQQDMKSSRGDLFRSKEYPKCKQLYNKNQCKSRFKFLLKWRLKCNCYEEL
jgi:hypothetical protein